MVKNNKNNSQIPYGYIYKITNKLTGEIYIGKHILKNEAWRKYLGSGESLHIAIKMFGKEYFIKSLEAYEYSQEKLSKLELKIMNQYKDDGYEMYNKNFSSPSFTSKGMWEFDEARRQEIWDSNSAAKKFKNQKIFDEKIEKAGAQNIIDYYNVVKNIEKTKKHFNISERDRFRKFLEDNGVEVNGQNELGRSHSQITKNKIRESVRKNLENSPEKLVNEDFINECKYCHEPYETKRNKITHELHRVSCDDCRKAKSEGKVEYILLNRQCDNDSCGKTYQASVNKFTQVSETRYCSIECEVMFYKKYNGEIITRLDLIDLYINKEFTVNELCHLYGVKKNTIYGRLQKFEISPRHNPKGGSLYKNSLNKNVS